MDTREQSIRRQSRSPGRLTISFFDLVRPNLHAYARIQCFIMLHLDISLESVEQTQLEELARAENYHEDDEISRELEAHRNTKGKRYENTREGHGVSAQIDVVFLAAKRNLFAV